jgi:hypothetical protein
VADTAAAVADTAAAVAEEAEEAALAAAVAAVAAAEDAGNPLKVYFHQADNRLVNISGTLGIIVVRAG